MTAESPPVSGRKPAEPVRIHTAAEVLRAETLQFLDEQGMDAYLTWEAKHNARAAKHPVPGSIDPEPAFDPALSALCLSGGGIRSAAFCLGVTQALAATGLLKQFHYLSTVSGGGYIGGWLTRCIARLEGRCRQGRSPSECLYQSAGRRVITQ